MSTNLGTAYVSVVPSMQGFGKAVESGMSNIDTTAAGAAMGSKAASGFAGGMAKNGAVIGAASALASKAFDAVASSTDRAVARVDTMSNFPKVMANMKISADDAQTAINMLSDGLDGLPTTLDAGARAVQRFTSYNNDVIKSADMFLAVNDAIMAGGTSAEMQAGALEQLTQAYTKGKMDMQEWRTIQQTMPAQLKQIAESMGLTTAQLGAGLRQAEKADEFIRNVSMDEFINQIMRLDKEGVNGFASFAEQARTATTGIETALTNLNTRISRGVAELINSVGQENISGAINTLSSGIVGIGKDLGQDLKVATAFVKEHEDEIKALSSALMDIAPMAIRAWGAFKVFKGGKALFSSIGSGVMGLAGSFDKLTKAGSKLFYLGDDLAVAGKRGGDALKGMGNAAMAAGTLISSMTAGSVALSAGLAVGIVALDAYNKYLWDAAAAEYRLTDEQQAVVDRVNTMASSYGQLVETRQSNAAHIERESNHILKLKDSYNALVDENGNVIAGYETQANIILDQLANAMGVERSYIESLIDEYGKLGNAAEEAMEKRKAEKLREAYEPEYNEAVTNYDQTAQDYASATAIMSDAATKYAKTEEDVAQAQQWALDTMPSEALGVAAYQYGDLAYSADAARKSFLDSSDAAKQAKETLADYQTVMTNFEGLSAALEGGDIAAIEEWSTRITNSIVTAENGTRESLQAQVETLRESYSNMKEAVANGATGMEGSLETLGSALAIAEEELRRYDSVELRDKVANASVDDGTLVIAQDHVYQWNGSDLVDLGSVADVEDSGVLEATDNILIYNGTELEPKYGTARVTLDTSEYDNWTPPQKEAYVHVRNVISSFFGVASGGFFDLHASGGFITNGPTMLGTDKFGTVHIAGEDGREWVQKHADGTTSIVPIENKKYLAPYANAIASMIGGGSTVNNINVTLAYDASADSKQMARDITRELHLRNLMGA